ncbi:MAG: AraC family transcriptional regulator [Planctomycetales bacterium]|nr:AraC family transcriptional regulator [Planctomycetales bacterium]
MTDNKILDVCLDCGYRSASRFYVAFKTICGCTPREYRARYRC